MSVELLKENIEFEKFFGENTSSVMLKEDFIIPDTNPDVKEIVGVETSCKINNKDAMQDKIYVEGEICYNVLYLAELEDNCEVFNSKYTSKFSCYVDIIECDSKMDIKVDAFIEHIMSTMVNERKVCVEVVLKVKGQCFKKEQVDIVKGIGNLEGVQYLNYPLTIDKLGGTGTATLKNDCTLKVPMDMPQIGTILSCKGIVCKRNVKVFDGKVIVAGAIKYNAIYKCKNSRDVDYLEKEVPFEEEIIINNATADMTEEVEINIDNFDFILKDDELGESRIIDIECGVNIICKVMGKDEIEVIDDAYSPGAMIELEKEDKDISVLFGDGKNETIVKENIEVDDVPVDVVSMTGVPMVTDKKIVDDRVVLEGILKVYAIYKTKDEKNYVNNCDEEVPFAVAIDIPGCRIGMEALDTVALENIEGFIEAGTISVKALISAKVLLKYSTHKEFIQGIEMFEGVAPKKASIIIYIVQSGDTLWKIAKKYSTTVDKLMEINEIEIPELIKPGDKIIIEGRAVIV